MRERFFQAAEICCQGEGTLTVLKLVSHSAPAKTPSFCINREGVAAQALQLLK